MDYRPAGIVVDASFARQLERERNEARRLAEQYAAHHDIIFHWENANGMARGLAAQDSATTTEIDG